MSGKDRHHQIMRRLRSGESEALAAAADKIEACRAEVTRLNDVLSKTVGEREAAERQVRDQARVIDRLKREIAELQSR